MRRIAASGEKDEEDEEEEEGIKRAGRKGGNTPWASGLQA